MANVYAALSANLAGRQYGRESAFAHVPPWATAYRQYLNVKVAPSELGHRIRGPTWFPARRQGDRSHNRS